MGEGTLGRSADVDLETRIVEQREVGSSESRSKVPAKNRGILPGNGDNVSGSR